MEIESCTCGGRTIECHHEGTGRDADGWCTECDTPVDRVGKINCPECN